MLMRLLLGLIMMGSPDDRTPLAPPAPRFLVAEIGRFDRQPFGPDSWRVDGPESPPLVPVWRVLDDALSDADQIKEENRMKSEALARIRLPQEPDKEGPLPGLRGISKRGLSRSQWLRIETRERARVRREYERERQLALREREAVEERFRERREAYREEQLHRGKFLLVPPGEVAYELKRHGEWGQEDTLHQVRLDDPWFGPPRLGWVRDSDFYLDLKAQSRR